MQKQTDFGVRKLSTDQFRHQKQMVVVDPDGIAFLVAPSHFVGEHLIDICIVLPYNPQSALNGTSMSQFGSEVYLQL